MNNNDLKKITKTGNSTEYWNSLIDEIISCIIAAVFSFYISDTYIKSSGVLFLVLRVLSVVVIYITLKTMVKRIRRYFRTRRELYRGNHKKLNKAEAWNLADAFKEDAFKDIKQALDAIAFAKRQEEDCVKDLYLNQAFNYYDDALKITFLLIYYYDSCMDLIQKDYIKMYQIQNIYDLLMNCNLKFKQNNEGISETINKYVENHDCYLKEIENFINDHNE